MMLLGCRMTDLKPCPFCGNDPAVAYHLEHFFKPWVVECCKCWARGPCGCDEKEAIELWNRGVKE